MVCTYKEYQGCTTTDIVFTCVYYSTDGYCFCIKSFLIVNVLFTLALLYLSYIYIVNRKIAISDPRIWIIFLALTLACFNWLNYSFLKKVGWVIEIIYTLNFFIYFFESLYFMIKATTFVKDKRVILRRLFLAFLIFYTAIFVLAFIHQRQFDATINKEKHK